MFGFLKRLTQGAPPLPDDDPEVLQEMEDGVQAVNRAEAAGALPVLETQHRAIGTDVCHLAVPASMPDVSGGDSLVRFRCNSFGDAMLAVWMIQRLKK